MIDPTTFVGRELHGGFLISEIRLSSGLLVDAIGREAVAQTTITGRQFRLLLLAGMDDEELSITLYHEILEAATVASAQPPASVIEFNEGDFERAARQMHDMLGPVSPENLDRMLQHFGFSEP